MQSTRKTSELILMRNNLDLLNDAQYGKKKKNKVPHK